MIDRFERLQRVRRQGAAQLANALITNNTDAMKQILHTYRDDQLDVDYVDPKLGHPLCALAALSGKASVAVLLLQRGADPMVRNMNGRSVLYIAVECGLEDVVRCIIDLHPELDINCPLTSEMQEYCAVHVAAR
jgi:ankyrin repeat protein